MGYMGEQVPGIALSFRLLLRLVVGVRVVVRVVVVAMMMLLKIVEILVVVVGQHLVGLQKEEDK